MNSLARQCSLFIWWIRNHSSSFACCKFEWLWHSYCNIKLFFASRVNPPGPCLLSMLLLFLLDVALDIPFPIFFCTVFRFDVRVCDGLSTQALPAFKGVKDFCHIRENIPTECDCTKRFTISITYSFLAVVKFT